MSKKKYTKPLNRIVIGDVGSGKTIVAILIGINFLHGIDSGANCLIAPTEILAYQHYRELSKYLDKNKLNWVNSVMVTNKSRFLNGQKITKGKLEKAIGEISAKKQKVFWIGTHALLHREVPNLYLVMVDEQHRFGVSQRQKLNLKIDTVPHYLSFTATPIPRTLALTVYRDLKPHFLQRLTNRKEIKTSIADFNQIEKDLIPKIEDRIKKGEKVYVVCAKIEDKESQEELDIWSVKKATNFFEKYFPNKVLSVHGKQKNKQNVIRSFKESSEQNILIATTVIEVGVDIQEASLMIILNSERFGLTALHQIRGRVGRNDLKNNECVLVNHSKFKRIKRLQFLCQSNDGYWLAQKDLEIRGAGNLVGDQQSGFVNALGENSHLLKQEDIQNLSRVVDSIKINDLETDLPRLKKYLQSSSQKVWGE